MDRLRMIYTRPGPDGMLPLPNVQEQLQPVSPQRYNHQGASSSAQDNTPATSRRRARFSDLDDAPEGSHSLTHRRNPEGEEQSRMRNAPLAKQQVRKTAIARHCTVRGCSRCRSQAEPCILSLVNSSQEKCMACAHRTGEACDCKWIVENSHVRALVDALANEQDRTQLTPASLAADIVVYGIHSCRKNSPGRRPVTSTRYKTKRH